MRDRDFFQRQDTTGTLDAIAFAIAFGVSFLALGVGFYLLAGALTGWKV